MKVDRAGQARLDADKVVVYPASKVNILHDDVVCLRCRLAVMNVLRVQ
jgi:hypothetical protein